MKSFCLTSYLNVVMEPHSLLESLFQEQVLTPWRPAHLKPISLSKSIPLDFVNNCHGSPPQNRACPKTSNIANGLKPIVTER
jgi:hypothetical protein